MDDYQTYVQSWAKAKAIEAYQLWQRDPTDHNLNEFFNYRKMAQLPDDWIPE